MRDTVVMYLELILGFCTHTSLFDFVFPCVFALSFNEEFITHTRERERERDGECKVVVRTIFSCTNETSSFSEVQLPLNLGSCVVMLSCTLYTCIYTCMLYSCRMYLYLYLAYSFNTLYMHMYVTAWYRGILQPCGGLSLSCVFPEPPQTLYLMSDGLYVYWMYSLYIFFD